jgi:DNA-binding NtrC family response regulator
MARVPTTTTSILVVDDDRRLADMLAKILAAEGHRVDIADNGRAALTQLARRAYDVVITDVRMPELDGPGLYREMERRWPALLPRVIFITGDSTNPDTQRFLSRTGAPALHKPFDLDDIHRIVREALDRRA